MVVATTVVVVAPQVVEVTASVVETVTVDGTVTEVEVEIGTVTDVEVEIGNVVGGKVTEGRVIEVVVGRAGIADADGATAKTPTKQKPPRTTEPIRRRVRRLHRL